MEKVCSVVKKRSILSRRERDYGRGGRGKTTSAFSPSFGIIFPFCSSFLPFSPLHFLHHLLLLLLQDDDYSSPMADWPISEIEREIEEI